MISSRSGSAASRLLLITFDNLDIDFSQKKRGAEMARKQTRTAQDPYEEEYGPSQVIYINESAQKRLNGDEGYGKWYQTCRYSTSPTTEFCIKTVVPESSLENGVFHPDRFEPDIVAERCEKVSPKEIARSAKDNRPRPIFKKGDKVAIVVHGAGVTSYEPHIVEGIRRGVVYLENNDDFVFDANTGRRTKCESSPFGFWFQIVPKTEVPVGEWKRRCKDFDIEP